MAMAITITTTAAATSVASSHRRLLARRYLHFLLHKSKLYPTKQKINCISTSTPLLGLPSSSVSPNANIIMKLQLAPPFLAAAFSFLSPSQTRAFFTQPSSSWQKSMAAPILSSSSHNQRRFVSSSMKELSVAAAAFDESTTTATASKTDTLSENMIVKGEILSYYTSPSSSGAGATLVAVKICEEDLLSSPMSTPITSLSASGLGAGSSSDGSVPMADGSLERPIGLENSLFSKSSSSIPSKDVVKSSLQRVIADGDPTGRTVYFSNGSKGIVLAHRHPISFVLIDASAAEVDGYTVGDTCSISTELASLTPSSIPPGSTVDYLGRHVCLLNDGSVSRSLPKAAASSEGATDDQLFDLWTKKLNDVSPIVSSSIITTTGKSKDEQRPIFVPIPKISDIGLIDSPLVTGITAIDALTPIGLGQNMLVIAEGEDDDDDDEMSGKVNKRGWMMNLLRNVVENNKKNDGTMRCYYCLTSGDSKVRSNVWNDILEAGIQEDIVTLFSNHDSCASANNINKDDASLEAAEAVAVAAAACTLGEHHALTTGGDSVVIVDDINLHKSLWDMTTQELVKVYGVNAVVEADLNGGSSSEMRGFFSGLIQRAARFNVKKGGGSVTLILLSTLPNLEEETIHDEAEDEPTFVASDFDSMSEKIKDRIAMLVKAKVPLTPTNLRKIKLPVPKPSENENAKRLALQHVEDLISMSDGQIWFDVKQDRSPPLDPSRSLTRVGVGADTRNCRADAPALRSVVGSLRFEFQQATDMMSPNTAEGAGKNLKQEQRRDAFLLAMHQEPNEGRKLSQECVLLLAASRGHLDAVIADGGMPGSVKGKEALAGMLQYLHNEAGEIMQSIDDTLDLSFDERNVLDEAIQEYFSMSG